MNGGCPSAADTLLSDGGEIFMPRQDGPSGVRGGMLRDKFGTSWMILFEPSTPRDSVVVQFVDLPPFLTHEVSRSLPDFGFERKIAKFSNLPTPGFAFPSSPTMPSPSSLGPATLPASEHIPLSGGQPVLLFAGLLALRLRRTARSFGRLRAFG